MRFFGLCTSALLLSTTTLLAQQSSLIANPPTAPDPQAAALQRHLMAWQGAMENVETLAASMKRTEKDKTFNTIKSFKGYAQYRKVGTGADAMDKFMIEFRPENNMQVIKEKFVSTGTYMFEFSPSQKEIRYRAIPKRQQGQPQTNFLSFLLGMKAQEALQRYTMQIAKEDDHYVYLDVWPKLAADRTDFVRARIVLMKANYLPRQLWFEQPNGGETTWDIPQIRAGVAVDNKLFDAPKPPAGWKLIQAVTPTAPPKTETSPTNRIIRSSDGK